MVRLIIMREKEGRGEEVTFTYDFDHAASYFCRPGFEVVYDKKVEDVLPAEFPTEETLSVR